MEESIEQQVVTIGSAHGLHGRPALMLSRLAMRYQSVVEIALSDTGPWVNVRSVYMVLRMKIKKGTSVCLRASGPDSSEALENAAELIQETANHNLEHG